MLVGSVVVADHTQLLPCVCLGDLLEASQEFLVAVPGITRVDDLAGGDLECGEQGGLAVLLFSAVRVQVGESGASIAFGPLRWPVRRVALSRIDTARSEERNPASVGGWGYRGLPGAATIMIRSGECLVLRYRRGGELGISVDDAERGAALINALLAEDRV